MILSSLAAAFSPFAQANPLTGAVQGVAANAASAPAAPDSSSAATSASTAATTTTPAAHHHHRHHGGGSTSAGSPTAGTTSGTGTAAQPAVATGSSSPLGNLLQSFETALESALSGQGATSTANPAQAAGIGATTTLFA